MTFRLFEDAKPVANRYEANALVGRIGGQIVIVKGPGKKAKSRLYVIPEKEAPRVP